MKKKLSILLLALLTLLIFIACDLFSSPTNTFADLPD
jgi:hypothetical protein